MVPTSAHTGKPQAPGNRSSGGRAAPRRSRSRRPRTDRTYQERSRSGRSRSPGASTGRAPGDSPSLRLYMVKPCSHCPSIQPGTAAALFTGTVLRFYKSSRCMPVYLGPPATYYRDAPGYTPELTCRQPAQNGVLTDQFCRAIYCIHLSIMQIAITIT